MLKVENSDNKEDLAEDALPLDQSEKDVSNNTQDANISSKEKKSANEKEAKKKSSSSKKSSQIKSRSSEKNSSTESCSSTEKPKIFRIKSNEPNFNFDKSFENLPPMKLGRYYDYRLDLSNEFRELTEEFRSSSQEICFLYQNESSVSEILQKIIELRQTLDDLTDKLIQDIELSEKIDSVFNFYNTNDLDGLFLLLKNDLYPLVKNVPIKFPKIKNMKKDILFKDFNLPKRKADFEKNKAIKTPDNYNKYLKSESLIEKYDKFVVVVNTIIYIRNIIIFKEKFVKLTNEYTNNEEILTKKILDKYKIKIFQPPNVKISPILQIVQQKKGNKDGEETSNKEEKTSNNKEETNNKEEETSNKEETNNKEEAINKDEETNIKESAKSNKSEIDQLLKQKEQIKREIYVLQKQKEEEEKILNEKKKEVNDLEQKASKINLVKDIFKQIEHIQKLNEDFLNKKVDTYSTERDKALKDYKKSFYILDSSLNSNKIKVRDGTEYIESNIFENKNIEEIFIPSTVKYIQDKAFYQCRELTTITLDCVDLEYIGKSAFSGCENLRSFVMPNTIKTIEEFTFQKCFKLETIVFPNQLIEIKEKAFNKCKSLREIILPKTIKKLGYGCFCKCENLKKVVIPGVIYIFECKNEFKELISDEESTEITNFLIPEKCFFKCANLQYISVADKCNTISDFSFAYCTNINSITFTLSNELKIGNSAFFECSKIKNVDFIISNEESSLKIGSSSFENCIELEKVSFDHPEKMKKDSFEIKERVFFNCSNLQEFDFPPNSNADLAQSCFEKCEKLKKVTLPNEIKQISESMFRNCKNLENINLNKESITIIGSKAFKNCEKLELNELPPNTEKIERKAFKNCKLISINSLPEKTLKVGSSAFENCENIKKIQIPANVTTVDKNAFKECNGLQIIKIMSSSVKIEYDAFGNCGNLKTVLKMKDPNISSEAFEDCNSFSIEDIDN